MVIEATVYPPAGSSQEELNDWLEVEIGRRIAAAVENAEMRVHASAEAMERGEADSMSIYQPGGGWAVKMLAMNMIETLNGVGAKHYLEMKINMPSYSDPVTILLVRPGGVSPMDRLHALRGRVAEVAELIASRKYKPALSLARSCAENLAGEFTNQPPAVDS